MRFHQPIGIWLLLSPALWALWIAGKGNPSFKNIVIIILGGVVMRAAGCVINDIADRNFDKHVARTKNRPLTSGQITLIEAQIIFLLLIIIAGILVLQLNQLCLMLAVLALFLAFLYPFTKRWVSFPQFFLSLAFGMGAPIAFAAENGQVTLIAGLIFLINMMWTLVYDTEYAMADKEDDLKIKIKSTAILWGTHDVLAILVLQVLMVILLAVLGVILKFYYLYFIFIGVVVFLFCYQLKLISSREPQNCFKAFLNNQWVGLVIFLCIFLSYKFT